jgi:hypothetical protein
MPQLDTLASGFIKYIGKDDKEKVFVQTDKSIYSAGDDVWLRAYCIGSLSHKVMRESKSLFVDLVNDRDSLIDLIMLNNGLQKLDGRIGLPAGLPGGYYWLRAYTRRMVKEDSLSVYVQPVYVFNPNTRDRQEMTLQEERLPGDSVTGVWVDTADAGLPTIRFYPEGGAFIAGSSTKFGFTVFDRQGRPMDLFGYVTDSTNTIVAKYGTSAAGLGSFSLFADGSMKYIAHTIFGPGRVLVTTLPAPAADGYQLSVTSQSDDSVYFQVSLGDSVYKKFKSSYVLGVSRNELHYAAVGRDMYAFAIAKTGLPAGRTSLLLFNEEQKIVSQRDIYIRKDNPQLAVVADRVSYGPREKVNLNITAGNGMKGDGSSVLSAAVADDREAVENAWTNSLADIDRDDIVFPYKDPPDSAIDRYSPDQWDLLMLVQPNLYLGWQKNGDPGFTGPSWEQSDSDVTRLTGRVLGRKSKPGKSRIVTLLSNYGGNLLETDTIDESGRFRFRLPDDVSDSTQLNFQVSDFDGTKIVDSIAVDLLSFPRFSTPVVLKRRFSGDQIRQLEIVRRNQVDTSAPIGKGKGWLKPVTVERAKKTPVTYDESKIVSHFSKIIPGDQIANNPNSIMDALLNVPGVSYRGRRIVIRGGGLNASSPLLYADGSQMDLKAMKITLSEYLSSLNPRTIDFIEVLEGADASIYGKGSDGGVIYIHTLNTFRPDPEDTKKGLKLFYARGYYTAPLFREPDYDKKENKNSSYPDQRSTIYWNGNIITDNRGKAALNFFTADNPIHYHVSVVGVTAGGEIVSAIGEIIGKPQ